MSKNRVLVPAAQPSLGTDDVLRELFDQHFVVESALSAAAIDEVLALRYQVYCCERPFEDARCFPNGREYDGYDRRSVHALVRHRQSNECVAAVRLVLADEDNPRTPFPVETHCGHALPKAGWSTLDGTPRSRIAEISRLAISREIRHRMTQTLGASGPAGGNHGLEQQLMPYLVVGLFTAIVRLSAKFGISHWLAVMEPTLLRLLKRYGIHFPHVGRTINYHGRRRPAIAPARQLIEGIHATRPDVWSLMTDAGRVLPARAQPQPDVTARPTEVPAPALGWPAIA